MKKKHIILGGILALLIFLAIHFKIWQLINPERLDNYLDSFGIWAPIIYCFVFLIAVFIPYTGTTMNILGGLLFSPLVGTIVVITISTFGSIFPFLISKKFARERIKARIEKSKYKKYLHKTNKNSFRFVLYMRLLPVIPYELQNYIIGLIDISTGKFILATFVGLLPGTFGLIYLGNTLTDIQPIKLVILGLIALITVSIPFILNRFTKAKDILEGKDNQRLNSTKIDLSENA